MCTFAMSRGTWYTPPTGGYFDVGSFSIRDSSDINRVSRRTAEKRRRDRLASYIHELSTLVPMISNSARRMDKTSILRLAATHLLIHQTLQSRNNSQSENYPVDQVMIEQLMFEQLNGTLLIVTARGVIVFVSNTVEQLLGHLQTDLLGQSLYSITNPEDHDLLRMNLSPDNPLTMEWRKYFNIRVKRAGSRSEPPTYETVNFRGLHKPRDNKRSPNVFVTSKELGGTSSSSNDLLIFFIRLFRPEVYPNRLIEATKNEYITRHLLDGRIVTCDQRISLVAGYMSEEVSGQCAFNFMHRQDVRWVMIALRQMYDKGESKGSSCYRLLSKTGQFIYLRTFGYLEIDSTGVVETFVCVNSLIDEEEGSYFNKEMKSKYSAIIKPTNSIMQELKADELDVASVEDPLQLEAAVAHLITNLPSPGSENCSTPSPCPAFENQDCQTTTDQNSHSVSSSEAPKPSKHIPKRLQTTNHIEVAQLYSKRQKTEHSLVSTTTSFQLLSQKTTDATALSTPSPYPISQNMNVDPSVYKQNHLLTHNI